MLILQPLKRSAPLRGTHHAICWRQLKTTKNKNQNSMKRSITKFAAAALLSVGIFAGNEASAVLITGSIDFGGKAFLNSTNLALATSVTAWDSTPGTPAADGLANVIDATGSFLTGGVVPGTTTATMTAGWTFASGPLIPLWKIITGGFEFDLSSSSVVSQDGRFLNVSGTGTILGTGFDPTPGVWSFTIANAGGSENTSFTFASQTAGVPDGGTTVALLGFVLMGVEGLRRKFLAA